MKKAQYLMTITQGITNEANNMLCSKSLDLLPGQYMLHGELWDIRVIVIGD